MPSDPPLLPPPGPTSGGPGTSLNRTRSYLQFRPRRAIASFENLVVLANYEERLKEARKMVWRDRGEPAVEVGDLWECVEHGTRGGLRAGALAFAIRAGINLFILMARIKKFPRKHRIAYVQHALLGPDSFRAAAMLGCFVTLYKFLLNAFPILFPAHLSPSAQLSRLLSFNFTSLTLPSSSPPSPHFPFLLPPSTSSSSLHRSSSALEDDFDPSSPSSSSSSPSTLMMKHRKARLSTTAQMHQQWVRKKTRRWHAVVAGALAGGVAILFERGKGGRRTVIAQQLFVRGLQGSYNAASTKYGFRVPYGDVLVFSLCCGQILYGFLLRPDTLPRSYVTWINQAGKIPVEAVSMNRDLVRDGLFKIEEMERVLERAEIRPSNSSSLVARLTAATSFSPPIYGPRYAPCAAVHPGVESCANVPLDRFVSVFRWMLPIYGALHFIPMMLFKRKDFVREPVKMMGRAGWGTMRSAAFLGTFVVIYQSFFCFKHRLYDLLSLLRSHPSSSPLPKFRPPMWLLNLLISKPSFWMGGLLSGLSLFVEAKRRRGELAMYVLPKGLESAWVMARGKGLVPGVGRGVGGEAVLTAIGMGMVMSTYQHDPQHLSGLVRRILYQFIGPN